MANTRKRTPRKKVNRRVVRHTPEPLSKIDQHYMALHECYKAARKAGFTPASDIAAKNVAVTPGCERMPAPTRESLPI